MRVLAWDAPGYGSSTPLADVAPRAADYAGRLQAWLAALDVTPDAIVGHSLGALMASAATASRGRKINPAACRPSVLQRSTSLASTAWRSRATRICCARMPPTKSAPGYAGT
ncbi:hypothetical protein DL770_011387 [Monosporascus sp. CRB-9-2]|nr:hypothetical protein DL770_011387 [Monosporascus sp. CRB-9-2]